jgi:uncharacterized SAM-binding protein YcdF (DUF218 family)
VTAFVLGTAADVSGGAVSDWLALEDPVERCPALVALNGDYPARADEAARLYHAGLGGEVWLTSDPRSSDSRGDVGTRSNAARLVARGVSAAAIHMVPGAATGTRAELHAVAAELRRRAVPCAVLVTSPLHARRVRVTWEHAVGSAPRAVIRHAPNSDYGSWRDVLKELTIIVLVWLRFPR